MLKAFRFLSVGMSLAAAGCGMFGDAADSVTESSDLSLVFWPDARSLPFECEVRVGGVLVASTRHQDRPEFLISPDPWDDGAPRFSVSGPLSQ